MFDFEKYVESETQETEKTKIFVVIKKGLVQQVLSTDAGAEIHVIDLDTQDSEEPVLWVYEWPETQI